MENVIASSSHGTTVGILQIKPEAKPKLTSLTLIEGDSGKRALIRKKPKIKFAPALRTTGGIDGDVSEVRATKTLRLSQ